MDTHKLIKRGTPNCGHIYDAKTIHYFVPATLDGCHPDTTLCSYGGYHVWMSKNKDDVNCINCLNKLREQK